MDRDTDNLYQVIMHAKTEDELLSSVHLLALEKDYSFYQYQSFFSTEIFRFGSFLITDLDGVTSSDLGINRMMNGEAKEYGLTIHSSENINENHYFHFVHVDRKINEEKYTITIPVDGHYGEEAFLCVGIKQTAQYPPPLKIISDAYQTAMIIRQGMVNVLMKKKYKDKADILTRREKQCVVLMGHGLSDKEIATHMQLSYATIRYHINNISTKLGARNRTHIISKTFLLGIARNELLDYS